MTFKAFAFASSGLKAISLHWNFINNSISATKHNKAFALNLILHFFVCFVNTNGNSIYSSYIYRIYCFFRWLCHVSALMFGYFGKSISIFDFMRQCLCCCCIVVFFLQRTAFVGCGICSAANLFCPSADNKIETQLFLKMYSVKIDVFIRVFLMLRYKGDKLVKKSQRQIEFL